MVKLHNRSFWQLFQSFISSQGLKISALFVVFGCCVSVFIKILMSLVSPGE